MWPAIFGNRAGWRILFLNHVVNEEAKGLARSLAITVEFLRYFHRIISVLICVSFLGGITLFFAHSSQILGFRATATRAYVGILFGPTWVLCVMYAVIREALFHRVYSAKNTDKLFAQDNNALYPVIVKLACDDERIVCPGVVHARAQSYIADLLEQGYIGALPFETGEILLLVAYATSTLGTRAWSHIDPLPISNPIKFHLILSILKTVKYHHLTQFNNNIKRISAQCKDTTIKREAQDCLECIQEA